jgi:hypothetical protein
MFTLLHFFLMTILPPCPAPTGTNPWARLVLPSCLRFFKRHFCFLIFVFFYDGYTRSFSVMYVSGIRLSPRLFSFLHKSFSSYGDFNRFECSVFTLVYKLHKPYALSLFPLFTLPSHIIALPFVWHVLHSCPSLFRCLFVVQWAFFPVPQVILSPEKEREYPRPHSQ